MTEGDCTDNAGISQKTRKKCDIAFILRNTFNKLVLSQYSILFSAVSH